MLRVTNTLTGTKALDVVYIAVGESPGSGMSEWNGTHHYDITYVLKIINCTNACAHIHKTYERARTHTRARAWGTHAGTH